MPKKKEFIHSNNMMQQLNLFDVSKYPGYRDEDESGYCDWEIDVCGDDSLELTSLTPFDNRQVSESSETILLKDDSLTTEKPTTEGIESVSESSGTILLKDDSLTRKTLITEGIEPARESSGTLGVYTPSGRARGENQYFRYSWRDRNNGNRLKHRHIPGGNINSPVAKGRADKVKEAIAKNKLARDILKLIESFSN